MRWLPVDTDGIPFSSTVGPRVVFHEGHMHLCRTHTHESPAPLPRTNRTPMLLGLPLIEGLFVSYCDLVIIVVISLRISWGMAGS